MTLTPLQWAALRDASKLPGGIPILTPCTLDLTRVGLLKIEKTPEGPRAKITPKGLEALTQGTP